MANQEHLQLLSYGEEAWNRWRDSNPAIVPDLSNIDLRGVSLTGINLRNAGLAGAKLSGTDLSFADLHGADLSMAKLNGTTLSEADLGATNLHKADLSGANLNGADISRAELKNADLSGADLSFANLSFSNLSSCDLVKANLYRTMLNVATLNNADLTDAMLRAANFGGASLRSAVLAHVSAGGSCFIGADLKGADLTGADLAQANFYGTNLSGAILTGCRVFATGIWDVVIDNSTCQNNLILTPDTQPSITIDSLKAAGFVHLYLNDTALRGMFTLQPLKAILIIGSFTHRNAELAAASEAARVGGFVPIVFDASPKFIDAQSIQNLKVLSEMCLCAVIDITEPPAGGVRQPGKLPFTGIPVVPIVEAGQKSVPVFSGLNTYKQMKQTIEYQNADNLKSILAAAIIKATEVAK